jgi:hypothetical protein
LAGNDAVLNTTEIENDFQMKKQIENRKLNRIGKINDLLKRSSKQSGHSFNKMVWLYLIIQKDYHCHPHFPQRASLENKLKYSISARSKASTVVQSKVMGIVHLQPYWTPIIGFTGIGTWIIQMTAKMIVR